MSLESRYRPFTHRRMVKGASSSDPETDTIVGYGRGFIQPVSGSQLTFLGPQSRVQFTHRLYTGTGTNILDGDIIEQDGLRWTVVFADQPKGISAVQHHREVLLQGV